MGIFSFFKKTTKTGADTTVESSELTGQTDEQEELEGQEPEPGQEGAGQAEAPAEVGTSLSVHPDWEVSKEQEYVLKFLSNDLPKLKANQLSLSGIDIEPEEKTGNWQVEAFLRSSLNKEIKLGSMELLVLDSSGKPVAAQEFDMSELGTIPARSDRPWVFEFRKENIRTEEVPGEGWKLTFNIKSLLPHMLDLDPTWKDALTDDQKKVLAKAVSTLPKLKPGEVNVTGFQIRQLDNGALAVSLLIRNGRKRNLVIEKIPLEVLDAQGRRVAAGSFNLDKLQVRANTTKPWNFIFPKEMLLVDEPDFSRWTVRVIQPKKTDSKPPVQ
ncbi:accessory Sec system S-layer assembly protein [Indiicoccus explosivorum]|uniref:accessory Sec system S-layer assembly protein n=1 Tax=Indiicoccus explosivorum TaxID=1917864 RepID=UPI000B43BF80|nr:accessory Sec system S-layer assembly protein [Indiicoccus explosivorum]